MAMNSSRTSFGGLETSVVMADEDMVSDYLQEGTRRPNVVLIWYSRGQEIWIYMADYISKTSYVRADL